MQEANGKEGLIFIYERKFGKIGLIKKQVT